MLSAPFVRRVSTTGWLIILLAVGFALRSAVILFISDYQSPIYEYMLIAKNLLGGKGYSWTDWGFMPMQPTSFMPPLYVYWCAFFMWLSAGNYLPLYVAQALVAASGVVPAYRVGARMFSPRTGMIFAVLYTVYPEMIFLSSRPVPEFMYIVLCLWIIYLYLLLLEKASGSRSAFHIALLTGLIGGIATLFKEGSVVVIGAVLLALLIRKRPVATTLMSHVIPMVIAGIVVLTPWMVRNWLVQGRFIPIRTAYGLNLWLGNHEGATGTGYTVDGKYARYTLSPEYGAYMQRAMPEDEQDRDDFYGREAIRFIRTNPGEYLALCAKRLWYFVWFVPVHPLAKNLIYRFSYVLLLLVAMPGIVMALLHKRLDPVIVIVFAGFAALYVPTLIMPRYRIVPVLLLLLLASYALTLVWEAWVRKRMAPAAVV
jgi:4-amino-4-deoxy-L-arabinose transferase-like glycosyltransferase